MASLAQVPSDHAADLLNGVLKQIITLGVACIGFLFGARGAHYIGDPSSWFFYLSLAGFICCIVLSIVGQLALVSIALQEPKYRWFPAVLVSGRFWLLSAWAAFAVAVAAFIVLMF